MAQVQVNMRMDAALKESGDAVLERYGVSVAHAVRSVWQYMSDKQRLPDFMLPEQGASSKQDAAAVAADGAALATRLAHQEDVLQDAQKLSYEQLRDLVYDDRLDKWSGTHV